MNRHPVRSEHEASAAARPRRQQLDYILERIEHRLAWAEMNNIPDDLPDMVRTLAAYARRHS